MKGFFGILVLVAQFLALSSCTVSYHQAMAEDRREVYLDAMREHSRLEKKYLELLANLERMPKEPWLLEQKKIQMKELNHAMEVLLQSRQEFTTSLQDWENHLQYLRSVQAETGAFPADGKLQKLPWENQ